MKRTLSFHDFATVTVPALMKVHPTVRFCDGYCLGKFDTGDDLLDDGIDTFVPGGDSSYHCRNLANDHNASLKLLEKPMRFTAPRDEGGALTFSCMIPQPMANISTVGELTDFLAANPLAKVVEAVYFDAIHHFKRKDDQEIVFSHFNHFEDEQEEDTPLPASHPVTCNPDGTMQIDGLPMDYLDTNGHFQIFGPLMAPWPK